MKTYKIRNVVIGEGLPKVCLPIVGGHDEEIIAQALSFKDVDYDVAELRIDYYKDILNQNKVISLLEKIRRIITQPLLFTCRSRQQGGEIELSANQYYELISTVCTSQLVDLVDIELISGDEIVSKLVELAHMNHVYAIISDHDFNSTPDNEIMMGRLNKMAELKGDIAKIAYMPQTRKDVRRLLEVTAMMSSKLAIPMMSMSMSDLGKVSRITGELYGSALTFACLDKASAPGQININDMNHILNLLHS